MEKVKPNFLVIGAPKAATTTLYDILKQHPEIFVSSFKEPHFFDFDENWNNGLEWYLNTYFVKTRGETCVGEFTPTYLSFERCAQRIKNSLAPEIKFIIILRDPVERAYSHYLHTKRDNMEKMDFVDAMNAEVERLSIFDKKNDTRGILRFGYARQGQYFEQLKNYFKIFDRSQFLILEFDSFVHETYEKIQSVLGFLEVNKDELLDYKIISNKSSKARLPFVKDLIRKQSILKRLVKMVVPSLIMRQKIRNYLQAINNKNADKAPLTRETKNYCYENFFKDDIESLEELLSMDLSHWKAC